MLYKIKKINLFKPPLKKDLFFNNSKQIDLKFKILRNQVLIISMVTYILYYFTRQSTNLTLTGLVETKLISSIDKSIILMVLASTYGISKFIVGGFADRNSGRAVMILGLLVSAILNLVLGGVVQLFNNNIKTAPLVMMFISIVILAIFQGMGWPAVARMFAHWFTDKERGTRIGIWSAAQGIGMSLLPIIVTPLACFLSTENTIRYGFYYWIPSIIAFLLMPLCLYGLRDRPESEGLPTIEKWKGIPENEKEKQEKTWKEIFVIYILKNKFLWILGMGNIGVYIIRSGLENWSADYVKEIHHIDTKTGMQFLWPAFQWGGVIGGIMSAHFAKWFFQNRKAPVMIIGALIAIFGLIIFQTSPHGNKIIISIGLIITGFGIFIPQTMIGAAAIELTNKKAAATASGFTGLLGYFGQAVMANPVLILIKNNNWNNVMNYFYITLVITICTFIILWNKNEKNKIL